MRAAVVVARAASFLVICEEFVATRAQAARNGLTEEWNQHLPHLSRYCRQISPQGGCFWRSHPIARAVCGKRAGKSAPRALRFNVFAVPSKKQKQIYDAKQR